MRGLWWVAFAALVLGIAGTHADDDAPPPIRQFDVPTVERLGRAMYEQDQLAWKATDILFAKYSRAELQAEKQQLWVVDKFPDRDVVRFVDNRDTGPVPAYDVTFIHGADPVLSSPAESALTTDEIAQYNARMLAGKHVSRPCAPTYNTIALKDPEGDGWLVWAMAATTDPNAIVIGGHYRFTISNDGKTLNRTDALSRGCLTIEKPKLSGDQISQGAFVTNIVSPLPLEIHVFANLTSRDVIRVGTPDGSIWKADQGLLTEIQMDSPGADGFAARSIAGREEICRSILSKPIDGITKYFVGTDNIRVIDGTEKGDIFNIAAPSDAKVVGVSCGRNDIVPAPNDYKVLRAGFDLFIIDRGTGHPKRSGKLEMAGGKVIFQLTDGDALTPTLQARMDERIASFQKTLATMH